MILLFGDLMNGEGGEGQLYIVCGPAPMIDSTVATLRRLGIPGSRILDEKFSYD